MRRKLSILVAFVLVLSLWTVPVYAEEAAGVEAAAVELTDADLVDKFVDEVFDLSNKQEFVDLLLLIKGIGNQEDMLAAYGSAFNGLSSGQQDRLESFGVTLEAMGAFTDFVSNEEFSQDKLEDYLGLDGSSEDPDSFRDSIASREEEFRTAMEAAGADLEKLDLGFSRLDKLFELLHDASTVHELGISLPFLIATAEYSDLTLDEEVAVVLVDVANSQLDDKIDEGDTVVDGIQDFVDYYNEASDGDQVDIYDYLSTYGFIEIEVAVIPEDPDTTGDTGTTGDTRRNTAAVEEVAAEEIDILDEDPVAAGTPTFTDLDGYQWAIEAINALFGAGVIDGISATELAPGNTVSRAEFATMLVRLLELTEMGDLSSFSDVEPGAWYYEAMSIAYQAGILEGKGDGLMAPDAKITREEMSTMIARTMISRSVEAPTAEEIVALLSVFNDHASISAWAEEGSAMSTEQGIIQGLTVDDKLHFMPKSSATRAEAIVMLYRLSDIIDTVLTPEATDVVVQ